MGFVYAFRRWRKLNRGHGRAMRDAGAAVMACPHCGNDTPIYRSEYDADRRALSFSVCVWCEGYIEYDGTTPRTPYATEHDRWAVATREAAPFRVDDWRQWARRLAPDANTPSPMSQLFVEELVVGR